MNDITQILCKAKRKDNGNWVEGYYCPKKYYCFDNRTEPKHVIITEFSATGVVYFEIDIDTLCRCTGVPDQDKNKIWENDIIQEGCNGLIGKVIWDTSTATFKLENFGENYTIKDAPIEWEVIGNAFDNPEFLQSKTDINNEYELE